MHIENDSHLTEIKNIGEEGEKSVQDQSRKYQSILDSKKIIETRSELEDLLAKTNEAFGKDKSLITKVLYYFSRLFVIFITLFKF